MKTNLFLLKSPSWALFVIAATMAAPGALATPSQDRRAAARSEARYQRDAAVCLNRRYTGDKDECLSKASTARAGREPLTVDPDPGRYARNALKRCEPLPESDRADCLARMQGSGTTSGSVTGGGIYRELATTREQPATPAQATK